MDNNILVSIVVPAYNAEEYIKDCLVATLNQTYSNIEVIIVDDGSTDSTLSICREYSLRDHRIRIVENTNNGVSAARNLGISNARGKYIVFFDADDCPDSILIECYMNAMREWQGKRYSFIMCGMYFDNVLNKFVENRLCILESCYGYIEGENYLLRRNFAANLAWLEIFNYVTNKIYDVAKIRELEISFDESISIGEDLKFNLDYLDKCPGNIGMINKPLYHYIKRNGDSLSFSFHENDIENTKEVYRRFLEWEKNQKGVTRDNILVIKSVFITEWTRRLTSMRDYSKQLGKCDHSVEKLINNEISSKEYQKILKEVHRAKKISNLRYFPLRLRMFGLYCFLRKIYCFAKG